MDAQPPSTADQLKMVREQVEQATVDSLTRICDFAVAAGLAPTDLMDALENGYQRLEIAAGRRPVSVLQVPPGSVVVVDDTVGTLGAYDPAYDPADVLHAEIRRVSGHDKFTIIINQRSDQRPSFTGHVTGSDEHHVHVRLDEPVPAGDLGLHGGPVGTLRVKVGEAMGHD